MNKPVYDLDALMEALRQQRDTLELQLHLAKSEVREEWQELEGKLEHLRARAASVGQETQAVSKDVFEAAKLMAEEIARGYDRIRKRL